MTKNKYRKVVYEMINDVCDSIITYSDMEQSNDTELKASSILLKLGMKSVNCGFKFLVHGIVLLVDGTENYDRCLVKSLYVDIAKRFNTTSSSVERGIRHSISRLDNVDPELCEKYLGSNSQPSSYSNSEFMSTLSMLLSYNK